MKLNNEGSMATQSRTMVPDLISNRMFAIADCIKTKYILDN